MAALTTEIKTYIVQALACFDSPTAVVKAVDAEFGVSISRQQIETHDPTKRCSKGLAKRWVYLFHDTRAAFHRAIADIPIANRSYRLRALSRMAEEAERAGNLWMVCQLYEQAAKECGDLYINRRRQSAEPADRRGPLVVQQSHIVEYTLSSSADRLTAGRNRPK